MFQCERQEMFPVFFMRIKLDSVLFSSRSTHFKPANTCIKNARTTVTKDINRLFIAYS